MGRRLLGTAAAAGAAALLTLGAAAPASAAPITSGTLLWTDWITGTLYSADIAAGTGVLTQIGPVQDIPAITALDVNDGDRLGYAVTYGEEFDDDEPTLYALDANTGTYTFIGVVSLADGTPLVECLGLDLYQGRLALTCGAAGDGDNVYSVGTVDPGTAVYTPLINDTPRLAGIATDPVSGQLYGFSYSSQLFTLDLAADSATPAGATTIEDPAAGSFDNHGALWVVEFNGEVYTIEPGDPPVTAPALTFQFEFDGGEGFDVISPALPATGPGSLIVPFGVAAIALLAGLALVVLRRPSRS